MRLWWSVERGGGRVGVGGKNWKEQLWVALVVVVLCSELTYAMGAHGSLVGGGRGDA